MAQHRLTHCPYDYGQYISNILHIKYSCIPSMFFIFFATRKKMPTKVFYSGFAISLFQYLFCICFVKNSYDIHLAIVFNMFDSEIATINMCDIHIATILLTVTILKILYRNYFFKTDTETTLQKYQDSIEAMLVNTCIIVYLKL